jgi:hypothetical protein
MKDAPTGTLTTHITAALSRFGQMRRAYGNQVRIQVYNESVLFRSRRTRPEAGTRSSQIT